MIFIKHRCNTINSLKGFDVRWGAEIDLRSDVSRLGSLHLSHDPWQLGEDFSTWLDIWKSMKQLGPLIVNTKEDGLETKILELLAEKGIQNFFFLDTQIPTLVRLSRNLPKRMFASRFSSYEPEEFVNKFSHLTQWLWVDCFDARPVFSDAVAKLKSHFKICLVSPELQGKALEESGESFLHLYAIADAVCTKTPSWWEAALVPRV